MSRSASPFTGRRYGVVRVAREWDAAQRSLGQHHTLTATVEDGQVTVFVAVDHCTTECVGLHAAKRATGSKRWNRCDKHYVTTAVAWAGAAAGIRNRHDHGSQFVSDDYQAEIVFLGMESSPSFVR